MNLDELHDLVQSEGEKFIADIRGDLEADGRDLRGFDFGFESYVGEVPAGLRNDFGADVAGTVYAGELGTWYFMPAIGGGQVEQVWIDDDEAALIFPHVYGKGGIYGKEVA